MTQMYKLCSEQLSQQDHYDFGMRALKSVLVMAGSLKRQNPDKPEDVVLIRALRDSNLPKFLKQDSVLFTAILQDLFPGVTLPEHDYGRFMAEIEAVLTKMGLQVVPAQVTKVIQFYETLLVRHGVMLVGPTGGGKTTVYRVLIKVLTNLHEAGLSSEVPEYQPVKTYVLNPKAITMGELYGEVNKLTLEWHDGLLASVVRKTCADTSEDHQWVICDGPVDALWIENMNTVLDDNKMLCLANSERIKLTNYVHMLFEVQDLAVASPATVSRCGMVYVDSEELGWMPYVKTWLTGLLDKLTSPVVDYLMNLFVNYVDPCLEFVTTQCTDVIPQVPIARVQTMCKLLEVLLTNPNAPSMTQEKHKLNPILAMSFVFSLIWGLAGGTIDANWDQVDAFVRNVFDDVGDARLPQHGDLWSCYVDMDTRRMDSWEKMLVSFTYKKEIPFFDMIVPTVDTVRYGYLLDKLLEVDQSVLFTGLTGVGKSVVARGTLNNIAAARNYVPTFLNFSAQTSSNRTQEIIESKLEKRKKGIRGAPKDKRVILFVDDLNMPRLDTYGSQPPIELLRQLKDFGGFYDRDKLEWITIQDVTLSAACGPPGGGRNPVTPRLIRHFSVFTIPPPSEVNLKQIFSTILKGFLREFPQGVRGAVDAIIGAAVEIYVRMAKELLPTPAKSHYVFNLRDLSKCVQGILQADPTVIRDKNAITRLFLHESLRVFHDRLISQEDKIFFYEMLVEMAGKYFGEDMEVESFSKTPILFGDFLKPGLPRSERLYEELTSTEKARTLLNEYLDEYNFSMSKEMKLVFFVDAIEHVCRIARMIRQDRGNALLVGVGGTGKQSLTKLAAYINDYQCFQIELTRGYDYQAFHEDLKKLYFWAGVENKPTVFLFTDTQIVVEEFLEDINNILNSGEVPNLFENEEYERLIIGCRPAAKEVGIPEGNRDAIFDFCINRVRNNLHVVLCMSPVGSNFRVRCRMFPSLVNCCTIDWFVEWPEDALYGVALSSFEHVDLGSPEVKECVARLSTEIHLSVSEAADRFYLELKRPYYTTPTSYLELLNLYLSMLATKTNDVHFFSVVEQQSTTGVNVLFLLFYQILTYNFLSPLFHALKRELSELRNKFRNGLDKILETNELVVSMEVELTAMRPTLEVKQRDTEKLMHKLGEDQEQADIVRTRVKEDEAIAKQKAQETQAIADDAQRDLDEAVPALEAANKALDSLDKNDISEIRVFTKPPQLVQTVMEAVCLMLGQKPDWATAKSLLGDSNFLRRLVEYPKDEISDALLKKLKKYIDNPDFVPEVVEKTSKACKSMCMWVRALDLYARLFRLVEPKRKRQVYSTPILIAYTEKQTTGLCCSLIIHFPSFPPSDRLEAANAELDVVVQKLRQKQAELAAVERKIAILQSEFDVSVAEKKKLEHRLALTTARLKRAAKLTTALADEQDRWSLSVDQFQAQIANIVGDVFVAAACVAYYGAFTADYRENLVNKWVARCRELGIPVSEDPSLFNVLGNAFELRQWNTQGLPRDQISTDNAILVTRTRRWPLMIDPQEQANRWIRTMEEENNLQVIKLTDMNLLRSLETCIRLGYPMLIEDVGETLDPALEPVLLRQTFVSSGRLLIRLGDSDVDYDKNFHLYLTTKMANPHYLPEVSIKVTLINFTVTPAGLEDQLLGDVTGIERPELEEQRSQLIVRINTDRNQLKATEDRILKLLFESEGNILDNEDLINTLNESKVKSGEINKRLTEATSTEQKITNARSKYSPVAARGSVMYFVITTMAEIDSMYQFSLKYFKNLFISTIQDSPESPILEERIQILLSTTTLATYNSVARSLFERDKLVFSFMLCAQIMRQQGGITSPEWNYFLLGSGNLEWARPPQPEETKGWLSAQQWRRLVDLAHYFPEQFSSLPKDLIDGTIMLDFDPPTKDRMERRSSITSGREDNYLLTPNGPERRATRYNSELRSFQKLLLISNFSKEEVVRAVTDFIRSNLGPEFIEAPECSLSLLFKEMDRQTPLVFILSPGSDPMGQLQRFAKEHGFADRIHSVSLGQGQGPAAEKLMEQAARNGDWVFLQNCHLAASWMIRLEELVKKRSDDPRPTNREFRLFLSSMPAKSFPISVLQNSVKVTNEPPKGLRANLSRALNELTAESFETHFLGETWRKLVFGICFFHAIVLERKKFGPLGWNISYDFNDSDRECALLNLDMFCQDRGVPWDALTYITSEITYGGRVTDFWDQRCLRTILERFFHPKTLEPTYTYSPSGIYYPPERQKLQDYKDYVLNLPLNASPELFGMHENANLVYQIQETNNLIATVLNIQPRTGAVGTGKTNDEIVHDLANTILERIPDGLDLKIAKPEFFLTDQKGRVDSLTTVMTQEVDRFNKLLHIVKDSLRQLQKAIKGFVVMSEGLEEVYTAFLHNQIPKMWSAAAYPSLKPLSSWVTDLALRCDFINCWMSRGRPRSFWISGFFFPQGFLTGTLQNYARKYDYPIDHLSFDFTVLPHYRDQEAVSKAMATLGFNQTLEADLALNDPEDGVLIHGLFMDGFRWDDERMELADSILGETLAQMPVLHMKPEMDLKPDPKKYVAPLYKTSARAGVLSTTGHSTNFVVEICLPHSMTASYWIEKGMSTNFIVDISLKTSSSPKYWIERGAALICERDVEN
ncbi:ATPase family protein, partial [Opisthorchis viverrini]